MSANSTSFDDLPEFQPAGNGFNGTNPETEYHPSQSAKNPIDDAIPDEVNRLIHDLELAREFGVTIYRVDNDKKIYCGKKLNVIPDPDQLGTEHGPGDYRLVASWAVPNRRTPMTKTICVSIGQEYLFAHRKYIHDKNMELQTVNPGQNTTMKDALDLVSQASAIHGGKSGGSDKIVDVLFTVMKDSNDRNREEMRMLREQMIEDRKIQDRKFETLISELKTNRQEPKSLVDSIKELHTVKEVVSTMFPGAVGSVANSPEDNRPTWLQAIDAIGERLAPLLSAMAQGGFKKTIATNKLRPHLESDVGRKLMADQQAQREFLLESYRRATTIEQKRGVAALAVNMKVQVPPEIVSDLQKISSV